MLSAPASSGGGHSQADSATASLRLGLGVASNDSVRLDASSISGLLTELVRQGEKTLAQGEKILAQLVKQSENAEDMRATLKTLVDGGWSPFRYKVTTSSR
jgi:hypothetical protein